MRFGSSVTSISWIPSEAVQGAMKLPFQLGVAHWDEPLPDVLDDLEALRTSDRFRFANELRAWIEVVDGRIVAHGHAGKGHIGATTMRFGPASMTFAAVSFPDIQPEPEAGDGWVRFTQTAGGRTGAPMPRRIDRPPYVRISAPLAWTSLALTIHADGSSDADLAGASPFPRHWVYDDAGKLILKSGMIDFASWSKTTFKDVDPWEAEGARTPVAAAETALERELSALIMRGGEKPLMRALDRDEVLVEQGAEGSELYLLLDGVLTVEVEGEAVAEVGPGAILGERAILEGGRRTATLRATTPARVAVATPDQIDRAALEELASGHRREER